MDTTTQTTTQAVAIRVLPLASIAPDPGQPRKRFAKAQLDELAVSIATVGLLEPVLVRPGAPTMHPRTGRHTVESFVLIAGERRWRAAMIAGLEAIPAIIRADLDGVAAFEVSMIENVVRADMNAMEEAHGYQRLIDAGMAVELIAARLGKTTQDIRFRLGLLRLDGPIADLVAVGQLGTWDAWHIARLTIEGQHRVIRAMNAGELTGAGALHRLTLAIFEQENQPELFGLDEAPAVPAARAKASREIGAELGRALAALERAAALVDEADASPETVALAAATKRAATKVAAMIDGNAARTRARQLAVNACGWAPDPPA